MKIRPLIMVLGIVLLAFTASGSATEARRTAQLSQNVQLASSDSNLNAIIQERLKSPRAGALRKAPSALCATDGKVWSCAPGDALRNQSVIAVDGTTIQNRLAFGRLETTSTPCTCEREDDDSPWVCNPPGCMGTVDMPAKRSIDRLTTPQDRVTTPRELQGQGLDRRRPGS